jgi:hypothetical protein
LPAIRKDSRCGHAGGVERGGPQFHPGAEEPSFESSAGTSSGARRLPVGTHGTSAAVVIAEHFGIARHLPDALSAGRLDGRETKTPAKSRRFSLRQSFR